MAEAINAFHVAPAGYTRQYVTTEARGCSMHDAYVIGCSACDYVPVRHAVTLGGDIVALILDDDGDVAEWVTADSGAEFAATVAHWGTVVIREDALNDPTPTVVALAHEATLYADCFSVTLSDMFPSVTAEAA